MAQDRWAWGVWEAAQAARGAGGSLAAPRVARVRRWGLLAALGALAALGVLAGACAVSGVDFDDDGVVDEDDCAPADPDIHPGLNDPFGDDIDQDCDGADGVDADGDGFPAPGPSVPPEAADCNDGDPAVHPAAEDRVDEGGQDTDCDGVDGVDADGDGAASVGSGGLDCDDADAASNLVDADGDGNSSCGGDCDDGDPAVHTLDLDSDGFTACGGDCDDLAAAVNPNQAEVCDGADTDCDGDLDRAEVDFDQDGASPCDGDCDDDDPNREPLDVDGDGSTTCDGDCDDGDPQLSGADADGDGVSSCGGDCDDQDAAVGPQDADGDGFSGCGGDCDDEDALAFPGAPERCNGRDDACVGALDPSEADADGDGDPACRDCDDGDAALNALDGDGDGVPSCAGDCDDAAPWISPIAFDSYGDGLDVNCDGADGLDADRDGAPFGLDCDDNDPALNLLDGDGDGSTPCGGDCDDAAPALTPADGDFDGFSPCTGDCDDGNFAASPAALEACDGFDTDCDGALGGDENDGDGDGSPACADCDDADATVEALDADGDGFSTCDGDCDDAALTWRPTAFDALGDGEDRNCDGSDGIDTDGDGFAFGPDCDDGDASTHPGAAEAACDGIDSDCVYDPGEADLDGDGSRPCSGDCDDADPTLSPDDGDGDGWSSCGGDCDEADPSVHPGQWERADGGDVDCNGAVGAELEALGGRIDGVGVGDGFGVAVSFVGDLDGDGLDELLVGSREGDSDAALGRARLFFGSTLVAGVSSASQADVTLLGVRGTAVAPLGDVNGDGADDFATDVVEGIGIWSGAFLSSAGATATDVDTAVTLELSGSGHPDAALADLRLAPTANQGGGLVAALPSEDDGFLWAWDVGYLDYQWGFYAPWSDGGFINGDHGGVTGLGWALGGSRTTTAFAASVERLGGVYGGAYGLQPGALDLASGYFTQVVDGGAGFFGAAGTAQGLLLEEAAGTFAEPGSVAVLDGPPRVVVGFPEAEAARGVVSSWAGWYGSPTLAGEVTLFGAASGERAGFVANGGDVDGDGSEDLLVGAPGWDSGRGRVHLVPGAEFSSRGFGAVGYVFVGSAVVASGGCCEGAVNPGDFDGDGKDDLVLAQPAADFAGSGSGAVYVLPSPL